MPDDPTPPIPSRRAFLKVAGTVAATTVAASTAGVVACAPSDSKGSAAGDASPDARRVTGFDRRTLDALGEVLLPASLGAAGQKAAVDAFVTWVDEYAPVAEEMHGYGYSDIRYLPPDPAPGWRAQLEGLDLLARRTRQRPFAELDAGARREVVTAALAPYGSPRIPDALGAPHVALALLGHWTGSADAWDLALGARVGRETCRQLQGVERKPLPLAGGAA
ncbi:MAG TPA: gluconate 2-dehydrogenase subunit 3 family protein [Gemmatimonadaceae bacterium]|nr:gluconate 2-dehydrogenase subunit 3 family protein [Gemmatimonadaceae bacterium]